MHQKHFCVKSAPGFTRKGALIENEEQQQELTSPGAISLVWDKAEGPDLSHTGEDEAGFTPPHRRTYQVAVPPGLAMPKG